MKYRYLGKQRLKVSAIGYGCPTFAGRLNDGDEKKAVAVLQRALELGLNFISKIPSGPWRGSWSREKKGAVLGQRHERDRSDELNI